MSEQVQKERPAKPSGGGEANEFVKVDPGSSEAAKVVEKLKKAQAVTPKKPRRACCCC